MMQGKNGWRSYALAIMASVLVTMGVVMFTMGAGKASKEDVEKLKDRDVQQQILNENIDGRLKRLNEGQKELKTAIGGLPKAIADELRKGP